MWRRSYGGGRSARPRTSISSTSSVAGGSIEPSLRPASALSTASCTFWGTSPCHGASSSASGSCSTPKNWFVPPLKSPSTNVLMTPKTESVEGLERARDHAVALRRLVGVDADRGHALLAGRVDRAEAAVACDLEDDVRALRDLVERDLLALGRVVEVVRVRVQELDVRLRRLHRRLEAGDPVVDRRDLDAADRGHGAALRRQRGDDAGEVPRLLSGKDHAEGVVDCARLGLFAAVVARRRRRSGRRPRTRRRGSPSQP